MTDFKEETAMTVKSQARILTFGLRLAIFLYPFFFLLDWFQYPDYRCVLLIIRLGVTACFLIIYFLASKNQTKYYLLLVFSGFFAGSVGISIMCLVTGEGFASPYYVGLLQVIIISSLFFNIDEKRYALIIIMIVVQHFALLSFVPWHFRDLLTNILALGMISLICILIHNFIYRLAKENRELMGILPICAACKRIRNDKGYWEQVESYIHKHSGAQFSHGVCPDCARKLYPDLSVGKSR